MPVDENRTVEISDQGSSLFHLTTCQRILLIGQEKKFSKNLPPFARPDVYIGEAAYQYLLKILCGLKSRLIGENEIVAQFKEGYGNYINNPHRDNYTLKIIEKLFQDSKEIRSLYLRDVGQYSYAGMTKKLFLNRADARSILLLGSGQLAKDILKVMQRKFKITILARNEQAAKELSEHENINALPWQEFKNCQHFPYIINTIGAGDTLFLPSFFKNWIILHGPNKLFVDLGAPSVIETSYGITNGVIRLDDIFQMSEELNEKKEEKINLAKQAIERITNKRADLFKDSKLNHAKKQPEPSIAP